MPLEYDLPVEHEAPVETEQQAALKEAESDCARLQADLEDIDGQIEMLERQLGDAKRRRASEVAQRAAEREDAGTFARRPEPQIHEDDARRQIANLSRVLEATQLRRAKIAERFSDADYWRRRAEQDLKASNTSSR